MTELPTGTVTFLLTDVEGSTARWERDPPGVRAAPAAASSLTGSPGPG
jgi:class 3 adenylate cyclase